MEFKTYLLEKEILCKQIHLLERGLDKNVVSEVLAPIPMSAVRKREKKKKRKYVNRC